MSRSLPAPMCRQFFLYNTVMGMREIRDSYPDMGITQLKEHRRSALRSISEYSDCGAMYCWAESSIRALFS